MAESPSKPAQLDLKALTKHYGPVLGVGPISLTVNAGEFVSLLGPSGCGKTTTLRLIAGLEKPTSGALHINGVHVSGVPAHRRNIGLVFQNYALFPHLTVFDNVGFGLRYRKIRGRELQTRVEAALSLVNLRGFERRMPRELSGGQQQRVALARAIVIKPSILLFDEPLSNLDMVLRQRMQEEIRRVQREVGITTVYVTHDQNEAFALSDRIAILFDGQLHQYAEPTRIYESPSTSEVAAFIGEFSYLDGDFVPGPRPAFRTQHGTILQLPSDRDFANHSRARIAIRPHRVRLLDGSTETHTPNAFDAHVERSTYAGDVIRAVVRLPAGDTLAVSAHNLHELRQKLLRPTVRIELQPADLQLVPVTGSAPTLA